MKHLSTKRTCMYIRIENLKGARSFIVAWVFNFTVARFKMGSWKSSRTERVFFLLPMSSREFWDVYACYETDFMAENYDPRMLSRPRHVFFARYLKQDQNIGLQQKFSPQK